MIMSHMIKNTIFSDIRRWSWIKCKGRIYGTAPKVPSGAGLEQLVKSSAGRSWKKCSKHHNKSYTTNISAHNFFSFELPSRSNNTSHCKANPCYNKQEVPEVKRARPDARFTTKSFLKGEGYLALALAITWSLGMEAWRLSAKLYTMAPMIRNRPCLHSGSPFLQLQTLSGPSGMSL